MSSCSDKSKQTGRHNNKKVCNVAIYREISDGNRAGEITAKKMFPISASPISKNDSETNTDIKI